MALWRARSWDGAVLRGKVSAWEDVGGGERGGCLDAVEEEDLIFGRDQEDTIASIVSRDMARMMGDRLAYLELGRGSVLGGFAL